MNSIVDGYTLIEELSTNPVRIGEGKMGEKLDYIYIHQPNVGYVDNETFDKLNQHQNGVKLCHNSIFEFNVITSISKDGRVMRCVRSFVEFNVKKFKRFNV